MAAKEPGSHLRLHSIDLATSKILKGFVYALYIGDVFAPI
jgi:hypothetical protein